MKGVMNPCSPNYNQQRSGFAETRGIERVFRNATLRLEGLVYTVTTNLGNINLFYKIAKIRRMDEVTQAK